MGVYSFSFCGLHVADSRKAVTAMKWNSSCIARKNHGRSHCNKLLDSHLCLLAKSLRKGHASSIYLSEKYLRNVLAITISFLVLTVYHRWQFLLVKTGQMFLGQKVLIFIRASIETVNISAQDHFRSCQTKSRERWRIQVKNWIMDKWEKRWLKTLQWLGGSAV